MDNNEIIEMSTAAWKEKVYIETSEHIICGYVYMPTIGKKNRMLSEVLNMGKNFIAVKDCTLEYKNKMSGRIENHDFIQVNLSSIIIMRPFDE